MGAGLSPLGVCGIQPFNLTGQLCWTRARGMYVTVPGAEISALRVALEAALKNAPTAAELAAMEAIRAVGGRAQSGGGAGPYGARSGGGRLTPACRQRLGSARDQPEIIQRCATPLSFGGLTAQSSA